MSTIVETPPAETATPEKLSVSEIEVAKPEEEERRDVLLRAAELIEEHGWAVGWLRRTAYHGSFCLVGAISYASLGEEKAATYYEHSDATEEGAAFLYKEAARIAGCDGEDLYTWNDMGGDDAGEARKTASREVVQQVLRAMANGSSFEDAVKR